MTQRILVLGSGDVGSAVAHQLFVQGIDVVLLDDPAPAHPRRGMAFADAWFDGTATLDGVVAQWVPRLDDLAGQLPTVEGVLCISAEPSVAAAALQPDAIVDARMRKRSVPENLRAHAARVVGLGPGFEPGCNCSVAIETAWGDHLGQVLHDRPASALGGEPRPIQGMGRERLVYASFDGLWQTTSHIRDRVDKQQIVGVLDGMPVHAPCAGYLRGLTHDGVTVRRGQKIIEVDPRQEPDTHGLGARPAAIARGVASALGVGLHWDEAFFEFEADYRLTLDCMPMSMRFKLDACGVKLSLEQWRCLPRPLRELLLTAPGGSSLGSTRMGLVLQRWAAQQGWPPLPTSSPDMAAGEMHVVPGAILRQCAAVQQEPPSLEQWVGLTRLQRFALLKLTQGGGHRNWGKAWTEFGLNAPEAPGRNTAKRL